MSVCEVPAQIRELPTHHGFPLPWTWLIDGNGVPAPDPTKTKTAIVEHLCSQCGCDLTVPMVFIGGRIDDRLFDAAPAHPACARWSARNVPRVGSKLVLYHSNHYLAVEDHGVVMAYSDPIFSIEVC